MTKDTTKGAAVAADGLLLDDWFDAIEDGIRARVRGFIETMLEEELSGALSRPRYGRGKPNADCEPPAVVGVRHGHRKRGLIGTFGRTEISVPRARLMGADGRASEWRSASALSRCRAASAKYRRLRKLSGRCGRPPPRGHRRSAKHAVRLG